MKDITGAVYQSGKSVLDGTFTAGMDVYNINSGLRLYDQRDYDKLPDEVKTIVNETEEKMKNGEIEVPSDVE